jgi:hypothetical protein
MNPIVFEKSLIYGFFFFSSSSRLKPGWISNIRFGKKTRIENLFSFVAKQTIKLCVSLKIKRSS